MVGHAPEHGARHLRVVDRLVIHPAPLSFRNLCRRAIPRDTRYVVFDLDRTCFDGVNIGELLGFELIAREAYGDGFLDARDDARTGARFLWAWRRPFALARYLATGANQWAGPGLHYLLNLKLASRCEASYRRSFRRFGPTPVEAIQRVPQLTLFHQLARVPLPRLRELTTRILRRHRGRQVIDADDLAWLRGWCPNATFVVSSASPQPVVEAAAAYLGANLALYSEIDVHDERPSAPARFPSAATRRARPVRFAPLESLRINGGAHKIAALRARVPRIFDPGVISVGVSDTSYGEDHSWADHFTHVIDVNSPSPFSPIIDRTSPLESIHSARLVPSDQADPDATPPPGIALSGDALATPLADALDALDALEEASQRWRDAPDDERAALERAQDDDRARLDEAIAGYNTAAPGSPARARCLRTIHRAARALAHHEASLAALAHPQAMRAFAMHRAHERARAQLGPAAARHPKGAPPERRATRKGRPPPRGDAPRVTREDRVGARPARAMTLVLRAAPRLRRRPPARGRPRPVTCGALMWQDYVAFNVRSPLLAAFLQFMVLGTIGEVLSRRLRARGSAPPARGSAPPARAEVAGARVPPALLGPARLVLKAIGWGALGIYIKFMFTVASAGTAALMEHGYLPGSLPAGSVAHAFFVSAVMNIFLGPSMMIVHRLWDNGADLLLERRAPSYAGLKGAFATLLWLWIPLHTFTFTQAPELRIGIAAFLSLLLGVVLGVFARSQQAPEQAVAAR